MIENGRDALIDIGYLVATILLLVGLRQYGQTGTARQGQLLAMVALAIATVAALFTRGTVDALAWILPALLIGGGGAWFAVRRADAVRLPGLTGPFVGLAGGAVALGALGIFESPVARDAASTLGLIVAMVIGAITLGATVTSLARGMSLVAPISWPYRQRSVLGAAGLALLLIVVVTLLDRGAFAITLLALLLIVSLALGVALVLPLADNDLPMVAVGAGVTTGVAVTLLGLAIDDRMLVAGGTIVATVGGLLARSVLGGAIGPVDRAGSAMGSSGTATTLHDAAAALAGAGQVAVVPGYGLAAARAQHELRGLADALEAQGVTVRYVLHPMAGRAPGHLDAVLAEADVRDDRILDGDHAVDAVRAADVVLAVGANDIVNPSAGADGPLRSLPPLPLADVPRVLVLKRGAGGGYAGIDNALFRQANTAVLTGDARETLAGLAAAVRQA